MKILLITGRKAMARTREVARKFNCDVFVAPVDVASFLTTKDITRAVNAEKYDLILVPGLMRGNLNALKKEVGAKVFRGPKHVADLEFILENIEEIQLSKDVPACALIEEKMRRRALEDIKSIDSDAQKKKLLRRTWNILIKDLAVGRDFPIRVLAEINDANLIGVEKVMEQARYYINSGADIIDIGISEEDPEGVEEVINNLRDLSIPLSIDTMNQENIERALDTGIDMVLSFDYELLNEFQGVKVPSVIIPKKGDIPGNPEERIRILHENISIAIDNGFKSIVADLVLEPVNSGFTDSVAAYKKFGRESDYPVLMGTGNVSELIDADSIGVNALLCGIAMECNAGMVLTTEHSDKARGSVRELAMAAKMMFLAKKRETPPKDLGIDLLLLKEKKLKKEMMDESILRDVRRIEARPVEKVGYAREGFFEIFVDEKIRVLYVEKGKLKIVIEGTNAKDICDTINRLSLTSNLDHAFYLGREVKKAEIALKTGKSYVQDSGLFTNKKNEG